MASIILPNRLRQQPQSPVALDAKHWAAADIVFAYSAGRGLVNGRQGIGSITGTVNASTGVNGRRILPADATSYVGLPHAADHNTLGGVTIISVIRTTTSVVGQQGLVTKCETGGGTNTPWSLAMEGLGTLALSRSNSGFRVWRGAATLADNTDYVVAVSQGADISVAPRFYLNGVYDTGAPTSLYGGSGTGAPTGNTTSVKIGNRTDLATQSSTFVYDAFVFKRVLTDAQIIELSRNIHQVWKAPARRIWAIPASGYTLAASPGSFAVTGTAATLKYGRKLSASSGSFGITGTAATLRKGYSLQAASGSFSATGTAATLRYGRVIQAASASFQVSGTAASLKYGRVLSAQSGTFQISGTDATLTYGSAGSYTLSAQSGSFSVSGTAATLRYGRKLSADSGSFAFTGTAATLRYARRVIAEAGSFSITGTAATLTYSGQAAPVECIVDRTAIFSAIVERTATFQRTKSVNVRFN